MRRVLTPQWLLVHVAVFAAAAVMLRLGLWQWHRAQSSSGGIQNYAYAFQWPVFAVFGLVLWVKTLREELRKTDAGDADEATGATPRQRAVPGDLDPGVIRQPGVRVGLMTAAPADDDDPEVSARNAALAAMHAAHLATESRRR